MLVSDVPRAMTKPVTSFFRDRGFDLELRTFSRSLVAWVLAPKEMAKEFNVPDRATLDRQLRKHWSLAPTSVEAIDGVPREIVTLDDNEAFEAARLAYLAAQTDP
jgi:hypothetical protein